MEYICKKIDCPIYDSRAFRMYFQDMDIGILDIETTGLSPKNSKFILGGLVTPEENGLKAEQFFAESLSEEQVALEAFWKAASQKDVLITFNGQHFDLPFMRERAPEIIREFPFHMDLYQMVKKFSPIRKFLPNLKQKTIEDYMGLWQCREDLISGKDSVDLYYRFLTEKTDDIKETILLHNYDDIVQLYRLLKVLEKTEIHKAMHDQGFPVKSPASGLPDLIIEKIRIKSDYMRISGRQLREPIEYRAYEYNGTICHIHFNRSDSSFSIDLPVICQPQMVLLDMDAFSFDSGEITKYPACQEGFLILRNHADTNYMEINHFIKLFTERMITQWIINR